MDQINNPVLNVPIGSLLFYRKRGWHQSLISDKTNDLDLSYFSLFKKNHGMPMYFL